MIRVRSESKYVVDIVADEILAAGNSTDPCGSNFGIALTSQGEGRHQILIEREGVPFGGGIIR